jgi:hypothetical protein
MKKSDLLAAAGFAVCLAFISFCFHFSCNAEGRGGLSRKALGSSTLCGPAIGSRGCTRHAAIRPKSRRVVMEGFFSERMCFASL